MRILYVITKLNEMYGAQRHAVESIKDHIAHGHLCITITGETGIASGMVENVGVTVKHVASLKNSYNPFIVAKAVNETIEILNLFKPDLVISHSTIAGVVSRIACYRKKIPNIFTVQGWPFEAGASLPQRIAGLITEKLLKPYSDSYLCVSKFTADFGKERLHFKDSSRIYVCANMHVKKEEEPDNSFAIHKNVLMVAGFREQKDHLTALKALEKIVNDKKIPGLKFIFVGDGPKRNIIEDFIEERHLKDYIVLAGEISDVDFYYDKCDIVILPTYYEGLPLSLLEAIQKAKPVIATKVGGINEIVHDNINGNLIEVEDYTALAGHIVDYYTNNKIQELSVQSRRIYDKYFSYEKVSERLNDIVKKSVNLSVFGKTKSLTVL